MSSLEFQSVTYGKIRKFDEIDYYIKYYFLGFN